jgi:hypothetical protein
VQQRPTNTHWPMLPTLKLLCVLLVITIGRSQSGLHAMMFLPLVEAGGRHKASKIS